MVHALDRGCPAIPPEVFAAGKLAMREARTALVHRGQEAGEIRADELKLGHVIALAAEHTDGPDQADRLLALVMDGLRRGGTLPVGPTGPGSADPAEEGAEVAYQEVGGLHGREVAAAVELRPVLDAVAALGQVPYG